VDAIKRKFGRDVRMDRADFQRTLREVGQEYVGLSDKLFTAFDTNRDGRLDAHELAGGLAVLAGNVNKSEKLSLMFEMYNSSGSDSITRQEMQQFMKSMYTVAMQYVDSQVGEACPHHCSSEFHLDI
jgi:Ca2+-binding EF-hand superfamily protein